jgi:hypothetical protein
MGRKGVAVREARRAAMRGDTEEVAGYIARLMATHKREDLGPAAAAAALSMIARVERGEVRPRDPAEWVRVMVDVSRLEMGAHTQASLVAHLSGPALAERLRELQRQAGYAQPDDG